MSDENQPHTFKEKYLAEFVYGATDGTVTTFAIVTGAVGASLSPAIVIVLGFANLFADGFSMAVSNYLSQRSTVELSEAKGGEMETRAESRARAYITFISFVIVGFVPLLSFVFAYFVPAFKEFQFTASIALTAVAFIFIGGMRGVVTKKTPFKTAAVTLFVGGIAAAISYGIGYFLQGIAS